MWIRSVVEEGLYFIKNHQGAIGFVEIIKVNSSLVALKYKEGALVDPAIIASDGFYFFKVPDLPSFSNLR